MVFTTVLLVALNYGVTPENYHKIEFHMTRTQVLTILGRGPDHKTPADDILVTPLSDITSDGELWRTRNWDIWVVFDERGKVRAKMIGPSRQAEKSNGAPQR